MATETESALRLVSLESAARDAIRRIDGWLELADPEDRNSSTTNLDLAMVGDPQGIHDDLAIMRGIMDSALRGRAANSVFVALRKSESEAARDAKAQMREN